MRETQGGREGGKGVGGLDWICLAVDRYSCGNLMNAVINIRVQ